MILQIGYYYKARQGFKFLSFHEKTSLPFCFSFLLNDAYFINDEVILLFVMGYLAGCHLISLLYKILPSHNNNTTCIIRSPVYSIPHCQTELQNVTLPSHNCLNIHNSRVVGRKALKYMRCDMLQ